MRIREIIVVVVLFVAVSGVGAVWLNKTAVIWPSHEDTRVVTVSNGNLRIAQDGINSIDSETEQSIEIANWADVGRIKESFPDLTIPTYPEGYEFVRLKLDRKGSDFSAVYTFKDESGGILKI